MNKRIKKKKNRNCFYFIGKLPLPEKLINYDFFMHWSEVVLSKIESLNLDHKLVFLKNEVFGMVRAKPIKNQFNLRLKFEKTSNNDIENFKKKLEMNNHKLWSEFHVSDLRFCDLRNFKSKRFFENRQ